MPHFTTGSGKDFNDLHLTEGMQSVRWQLENALPDKPSSLVSLDLGEFLSMSIPERGVSFIPHSSGSRDRHSVCSARHRQDVCRLERRRGMAVLLIHHAGKSGDQRGTSAREDIMDTVISLRRPRE